MSINSIRLAFGRTVQIIDYKDSVRYDVAIEHSRDVEGGEAEATFLARALVETEQVFKDVEEAMLETATGAATEQAEVNPAFVVNEFTPLTPNFSPPAKAKKAPTVRRRRRPPPA